MGLNCQLELVGKNQVYQSGWASLRDHAILHRLVRAVPFKNLNQEGPVVAYSD